MGGANHAPGQDQDMRTSTAACMHRRQNQLVAGTSMAHVLMQRSDKTTQGNAGVILTPINVVQGSLVREHTGIDLLYFPCVAGEWFSEWCAQGRQASTHVGAGLTSFYGLAMEASRNPGECACACGLEYIARVGQPGTMLNNRCEVSGHTITTRATSTIHSVTIHPHMASDCRTAACMCTLRSLTTAPAAQYRSVLIRSNQPHELPASHMAASLAPNVHFLHVAPPLACGLQLQLKALPGKGTGTPPCVLLTLSDCVSDSSMPVRRCAVRCMDSRHWQLL